MLRIPDPECGCPTLPAFFAGGWAATHHHRQIFALRFADQPVIPVTSSQIRMFEDMFVTSEAVWPQSQIRKSIRFQNSV